MIDRTVIAKPRTAAIQLGSLWEEVSLLEDELMAGTTVGSAQGSCVFVR